MSLKVGVRRVGCQVDFLKLKDFLPLSSQDETLRSPFVVTTCEELRVSRTRRTLKLGGLCLEDVPSGYWALSVK